MKAQLLHSFLLLPAVLSSWRQLDQSPGPVLDQSTDLSQLTDENAAPKSGNLVFTSAGDHTDLLNNWIGDGANYDVFLSYYGDNSTRFDEYKQTFRWTVWQKGSKIGNCYDQLYLNHPEILSNTDYIFMLDDDIMFNNGFRDINRMFQISREHEITIAMPSFDPKRSVISWDHTKHDPTPNLLFRWVSVVEFNAPLMSKEAFVRTMEKYNPHIIGWGSPHLAVCANGEDKHKYAVVHSVISVNPPVRSETGKRELEAMGKEFRNRQQIWERIAERIGCKPYILREEFQKVFDHKALLESDSTLQNPCDVCNLKLDHLRAIQEAATSGINVSKLELETSSTDALVKFVIGGVQKAGTTTMRDLVQQHPDIEIGKEAHFFDYEHHFNYGVDWYHENIACSGSEGKLCGDKTPEYTLRQQTIDRVYQYNPQMKWIVLLREPVARALSQYHHALRKVAEGSKQTVADSFEEELMQEIPDDPSKAFAEQDPWEGRYLARGLYANQLEQLYRRFPKKQVLVLFEEEYYKRDKIKMNVIWDFLGVERSRLSNTSSTIMHSNSDPNGDSAYHEKEMKQETESCLKQFFKPHNERLFKLLGREPVKEWNH